MAKKITFEFRQLLFDVVALSVSFFLVVWITPLNAVDPFTKYGYIYLPYSIAWIIVAMLHGRYKKRLKDQSYGKAMGVAFNTTLITLAIGAFIMYRHFPNYSILLIVAIAVTVFLFLAIIQSIYFALRYASDPEMNVKPVKKRMPKSVIKPASRITDEGYESRKKSYAGMDGGEGI